MKIFALIIIILSIFINYSHTTASPKAGISGFGMKSEIKDRVLAEQEDYTEMDLKCFQRKAVCRR